MGREIARRLPGSSSKLSLQRCNLFFSPSPSLFLTLSPPFDVRSKAAVIFFPPFSPLVGKVSRCCFGTSRLCDVAGFLKGDQREKKEL